MRNPLNNCENNIDFLEWGGVTYILTNYREERKMANLKRAAALALSAAMFLQPMTASAATWGNIVRQ